MYYIRIVRKVLEKVLVNSSREKSLKKSVDDFRTRGGCRLLLWLDNLTNNPKSICCGFFQGDASPFPYLEPILLISSL